MRIKTRMRFVSQWKTVYEAFKLLSNHDRRKLSIVTLIQLLLGFLDLLGVIIIGLIALISVNGIKSVPTDGRVLQVINFLHINELKFQIQVAILGVFAAFILISRTILNLYFTRRILFYLSRKSSFI